MSRLPLRARLALVFALAMALVLAGTGLFIFLRVGDTLQGSLDANLRSRADDLAALAGRGETGLAQAGSAPVDGGEFAQVVDQRNEVVDSSPGLGDKLVLTPADLALARRGPAFFDTGPPPGSDDPSRVLAQPIAAGSGRLVVVGQSVEARDETLAGLRTQLLIAGPLALVLAALGGYTLAGAALRPVESMRRRVAEISGSTPGRRLPLPASRDEVRRLGETLNDMLGRLEDAVERERRFVADASHELRTPLGLLKAELELALRRSRSVEELEAAIASAVEESDRLAQLAEDLLVLARFDDGRLSLRAQEISADRLLAAAAARFSARAGRGRRISVGGASGLSLRGDEVRLTQALGNLLDNALRYGEGSVGVSAVARDGLVELHVTDEGPGFEPGFLERAFDRFSRADEARGRGGAGLGLAIVDVVARAHGGRAHAANRPGGGADVWLALPRRG